LSWASGEGRVMQDVDMDAERPAGWIRRIVNFLKERV
jgi:phage terminase large subunit-like protein